jgi:hypothetical protein
MAEGPWWILSFNNDARSPLFCFYLAARFIVGKPTEVFSVAQATGRPVPTWMRKTVISRPHREKTLASR